jgi:hypothetical protein
MQGDKFKPIVSSGVSTRRSGMRTIFVEALLLSRSTRLQKRVAKRKVWFYRQVETPDDTNKGWLAAGGRSGQNGQPVNHKTTPSQKKKSPEIQGIFLNNITKNQINVALLG